MHIPDGYLSPSTCATFYAAASPFWYLSFRRLQQELHTRLVPLISLFAAFSFLIMMFNIPLPGGTTGHAAGLALAAIVLGPWGSVLAISIALTVQALFFGDGGITALGANCFNLAVAGCWSGLAVYRSLTSGAPLTSRRRTLAAGLAGYVSINVAALLTAFEFGLQPLLFRDSQGAALYAPFPLQIAVPAMMVGHLTVAGLAEMFLTAGVVAYLQRTEPNLLLRTAGVPQTLSAHSRARQLRRLWAALGVLMILTPCGLLAVGSAWGEWSPEAFKDPDARRQIQAASRGAPLPAQVPLGLEQLSHIWTAPIPDYAPHFLRSPVFGYVMSAAVGTGLVILLSLGVSCFLKTLRGASS